MKQHFLQRLSKLHHFVSLVESRPGYIGDGAYGKDGPRLYVSGTDDPALMSMPREGTAMVRYKIKSRRIDERDDGPEYGADICISELEPVAEAAAGKSSGKKDLRARFAAAYHELSSRARDDNGQFVPGGETVSADDMATAYQGKKKLGAGLAGAGLAGLAGAALLRKKRVPRLGMGG